LLRICWNHFATGRNRGRDAPIEVKAVIPERASRKPGKGRIGRQNALAIVKAR
jgi:hypothetical protein